MRIAVLHNAVTEQDSIADRDVLVQVETVCSALRQMGHEAATLPCTLDLAGMLAALKQQKPDVVFNLVEALAGEDSLISLVPAVLEAFRIPTTGNRAAALLLTTQKLSAKQQLRKAGLPTPFWISPEQGCPSVPAQKWILKGVWDHASRDLDEENVFVGDGEEVRRRCQQRVRRLGRPCFAEQFIEGREFNLAMLAGRQRMELLPPAEIDFSAFPPHKPRIVGYRAKWIEDSFEYNQTPRRFDFPAADRPLLERLKALARQCGELFSLRGWARVEFRVDAVGEPWILEINANCCLSPDAGFYAALEQANIPFEEALSRIVEEAL